MRLSISVAAAFAVGLTASVAAAENRPAISLRAQENTYTPAKLSPGPSKTTRTPVSLRSDGGETAAKPAPAKAASPVAAASVKAKVPAARQKAGSPVATASVKAKVPAQRKKAPRKKGRERVIIDSVVTASVSPAPAASTSLAKGPYGEIISRYAAAYGVPVTLAHAVISVESNYRPDVTGSAGEIGLMQIKPSTARMMGYSGGATGLFNPETNIKYGMKYLGLAHQLSGGTTCGTILKYNAGHGARRMNPVSSAYCRKVKTQLVE